MGLAQRTRGATATVPYLRTNICSYSGVTAPRHFAHDDVDAIHASFTGKDRNGRHPTR
jgi:hypothetical protein